MKILVSDKGSSKFKYINFDNVVSFSDTGTSLYLCKIEFIGGTHEFVLNYEKNEEFKDYYNELKKSRE
jgi:hypothetical protein